MTNTTQETKKEMQPFAIERIQELTDNNDHTSARLFIIEAMKDDENHFEFMINSYKFIEEQQNIFGYLPCSLSSFRNETDKTLKLWISKLVSNADQVWQAL